MGKNYPQYDLHMRDSGTTQNKVKEEEVPVQRSALNSAEVFAGTSDVEAGLRSGGRPLDHETRRFMEARIGFDFRKVRIHAGPEASSSAAAVRARAYTVGNDVVFNEGRYAPHTAEGRRLLAHELAHIVQQNGGHGRKPATPGSAVAMPIPCAHRSLAEHCDREYLQRHEDSLMKDPETGPSGIRLKPGDIRAFQKRQLPPEGL
jgi:hypothetical protein